MSSDFVICKCGDFVQYDASVEAPPTICQSCHERKMMTTNGLKGPFIVFPHQGRPYVAGRLTNEQTKVAEIIVNIDLMEVVKNRNGPTGTLSTYLTTQGSTKGAIMEKIGNMVRKGKWA